LVKDGATIDIRFEASGRTVLTREVALKAGQTYDTRGIAWPDTCYIDSVSITTKGNSKDVRWSIAGFEAK